jgi:hypothetical protein
MTSNHKEEENIEKINKEVVQVFQRNTTGI